MAHLYINQTLLSFFVFLMSLVNGVQGVYHIVCFLILVSTFSYALPQKNFEVGQTTCYKQMILLDKAAA